MAKAALKTPSVLAFERKIDPSDALFSAGRWEQREKSANWPAIRVREKSIRGTISNRLKSKDQDPAKLDAKIENPNLQTVDVATLPPDADTLAVRFSVRILPGVGTPSACNNSPYRQQLEQTLHDYKAQHAFRELAQRYATNLANARFLWRNRIGAEQIEVTIEQLQQGAATQSWRFDALEIPLRTFTSTPQLESLSKAMQAVFCETTPHLLLAITAYVRIGAGQEVYPSQELILDRGKTGKSRTLYSVEQTAAMHSQKIGNALRTIDTWYPDPDGEGIGPIAVEPYGSVTSEGKAYRQPKQKSDFYTLLDNWITKGKAPSAEEQHYVIANFIRGGVFGESEKE